MAANSEVLCGLGLWRPSFLQPLASKKVYLFFYGCLGIIQGMFFSYLSASLSTIEQVFGIRSRDTALMMAGNEISQILFIFAMPLVVKVKKRPFWTSMGLFCSALGCVLMAIPHWVKPEEEVSEERKFRNFKAAQSSLKVGECCNIFSERQQI